MKFSNNYKSTGTSFAPRLQAPGLYKGCQCIKCQDINKEGSKAIAVLEWKVPNNPATIQDFILDTTSQEIADFNIGHAKELAAAMGKPIADDIEMDLEQAAKVFEAAAEGNVTVDVMITLRTNTEGTEYTNVRYIAPQNSTSATTFPF